MDAALKERGAFKERFDLQNQLLLDGEGELTLLRRRLGALENDKDKEKALIKKLKDGLNVIRSVQTYNALVSLCLTLVHKKLKSQQQSLGIA